MLTLIEGGFNSLIGEELITRVKNSIQSGRRTYLIVPEQQTLLMERRMCDILPPTSAKCFEVTNFTRFANTAFRRLGGISGEYCQSSTQSLIMWRTLTELSPLLGMTEKNREIGAGTVGRALAAVNEMKALAISQEDIERLIKDGLVRDARLLQKLSDLSLIYSAYKEIESRRFSDITDDMVTLAGMLKDNPEYLENTDIYLDGFTSFTEPQYKLIEELMRTSPFTVVFTLPVGKKNKFEYTELNGSRSRLLRIADRISAEKNLVRPEGHLASVNPILAEFYDLLWQTNGEIDNNYLQEKEKLLDTVRIYSASTPFSMCDFVASDIKRRVISGESYSDFAIIARSAESYAGILDLSLERAGVPYFFSRKRDVTSFELVKLIGAAYSVVARNYAKEDVLTYLKCGLSDTDAYERDLFELYVERWNIDGSRFTSGDFEMNPRGYEPFTEDDVLSLERINSVRERLTDTIESFKEKVLSAKTVREHAEALYSFLSEKDIEKKLYERSLRLSELGEIRRAEEGSKLWGVICSTLDLLVDTVGDTAVGIEGFKSQLMSVLDSTGIGSIPSHVDEVTVGSADMLRLSGKKHVYLIGVNDGEFPASINDNSYFSDRDKAELSALGLSTVPDGDVRGARELYSFTRAFSFAECTVTLLYARRSASLSPLTPSEVIGRIGELTQRIVSPIDIDTLPLSERLYFPEAAYDFLQDFDKITALNDALKRTGHGDVIDVSSKKIENNTHTLGDEAAALIYNGRLYLSQSRLESFLQCPLSYFLKYNLKLEKNERAELSSNVIGSFIHAILEDFFRESGRMGGISSLTDDDKRRIAEHASQRYVRENLGGGFGRERTKVAISRLCRSAMPVIDGLCDEFSECRYEPRLFELPLDGKDGNADPIIYRDTDNNEVVIRGVVDRVDTLKVGNEVFVRVIDYKTGSKEFSPRDLDEGVNLQMFLYLKSITDTASDTFRARLGAEPGDSLIPAGVIYTKTSIKDATVKHSDNEEARLAAIELSSREGMVLDDDTALGAMNPRYTPLKYPETSRNAKSNEEKKYSLEDWRKICGNMEKTVLDISGRMRTGDISASPREINKTNPCDYCSFKAICRSEKQ